MATVLDKELKRQITVDGVDYTLAVGRDGLRLTGKGKRKPEVALRWLDLLSGEAALAVALNASLGSTRRAIAKAEPEAPSRAPSPQAARSGGADPEPAPGKRRTR